MKRYLKIVNSISLFVQATCLCFKKALIGKFCFRNYTKLNIPSCSSYNCLFLGIGRDFDICQKIAVKFPTPGKNVRSNITEFPTQGNICGHGHRQKFKYPYPRDSKIIKMPFPRAKAINQIPALCPASPPPPRRLDIDRCINVSQSR